MGPAPDWEGTLPTIVGGHEFLRPVWLGCPGDWPARKEALAHPWGWSPYWPGRTEHLADASAWSTLRLGPHLLAVGPATGSAMPAVRRALRGLDAAAAGRVAGAADGATALGERPGTGG